MRALTYAGDRKIEWREAETPPGAGPGQAVVRPLAVATCDLDAAIVSGQAWWFAGEFPLGHECVAEIVEVGDGVDGGLAPGALVSVPFQVSCGECVRCQRGDDAHCESVPRLSFYGMGEGGRRYGGFLSDLALVPYAEHMLVPVPDGVGPEQVASLSDNIPDAYRTVAGPLRQHPGSPVLIVGGAGSIDVYATALALALGAERVDYVGPRESVRERAAAAGATVVGDEYPERLGPYPITVDASQGDHAGLHLALRSTEPEGISTSIPIYAEETTPVPLFEMYTKGITFKTGMVSARPLMDEIMELVVQGRFAPERVTSAVVPFDDAAEALAEPFDKLVMTRD
jgi:threonine dehydrogenase-like Zn-dependent dehydrogenase